jgi:hypothetical protein
MITTSAIASEIYALALDNKFEQIQRLYFADDAKSIEAEEYGALVTVQGLDNIIAKGDAWQKEVEEVHGGYVLEPKVFGNYIFMEMGLDITMKGQPRMEMKEMVKYEVKEGKIISEEFFY